MHQYLDDQLSPQNRPFLAHDSLRVLSISGHLSALPTDGSIKQQPRVRIRCSPPARHANFSLRLAPRKKGPVCRHIRAQNRPRAAPFQSRISAHRAFLARISPGHDCRVVVRDAGAKTPPGRQQAALLAAATRYLSDSLQPSEILRCNVDNHLQFEF